MAGSAAAGEAAKSSAKEGPEKGDKSGKGMCLTSLSLSLSEFGVVKSLPSTPSSLQGVGAVQSGSSKLGTTGLEWWATIRRLRAEGGGGTRLQEAPPGKVPGVGVGQAGAGPDGTGS